MIKAFRKVKVKNPELVLEKKVCKYLLFKPEKIQKSKMLWVNDMIFRDQLINYVVQTLKALPKNKK